MKRKELKTIAKQIAHYEQVIQTTEDKNEKHEAENMIIRLTDKVGSLTDMMELDELIQEFLNEKEKT